MFYIYIIYSPSSDKYYVDFLNSPQRRSIEHNTGVVTKKMFECRCDRATSYTGRTIYQEAKEEDE